MNYPHQAACCLPRGLGARLHTATAQEGWNGWVLAGSDWTRGDYSSHNGAHVSKFACEKEGTADAPRLCIPVLPAQRPQFSFPVLIDGLSSLARLGRAIPNQGKHVSPQTWTRNGWSFFFFSRGDWEWGTSGVLDGCEGLWLFPLWLLISLTLHHADQFYIMRIPIIGVTVGSVW